MTTEKLENLVRMLVCIGAIAGGTTAVTACGEGPFEEAGEAIDEAGDEIGDEIDEEF
jgi:hypothetical protein